MRYPTGCAVVTARKVFAIVCVGIQIVNRPPDITILNVERLAAGSVVGYTGFHVYFSDVLTCVP